MKKFLQFFNYHSGWLFVLQRSNRFTEAPAAVDIQHNFKLLTFQCCVYVLERHAAKWHWRLLLIIRVRRTHESFYDGAKFVHAKWIYSIQFPFFLPHSCDHVPHVCHDAACICAREIYFVNTFGQYIVCWFCFPYVTHTLMNITNGLFRPSQRAEHGRKNNNLSEWAVSRQYKYKSDGAFIWWV